MVIKKTHKVPKGIIIFLAVISILGLAAVFLATSLYGAGVSGDAIRYLSTADHLKNGVGFYNHVMGPYKEWPPLYPLILAILSLILGIDVFVIGWYLNIIIFGLIIFSGGMLIYKTIPNEPIYTYLGGIILLTSLSLIKLAANIVTDPLFILLVILFLLKAKEYLEKPDSGTLAVLAIIAGLEALLRYAGITVIATGIVVIIYVHRKNLKKILKPSTLFISISTIPVAVWILFNVEKYVALFSYRLPVEIPKNFAMFIQQLMRWVIPYSILSRLNWIYILVGVILIVITGNRRSDFLAWAKQFSTSSFFPINIFIGIYTSFVILTASNEHLDIFDDRYSIVILPALLPVLFQTFIALRPRYLRKISQKAIYIGITIFFIFWLAYPLNVTRKYITASLANGEASYNIYNTRALRASEMTEVIESLPIQSGSRVYSNYETAAWFLTRVSQITSLPLDYSQRTDRNSFYYPPSQDVASFFGKDTYGYIIWIKVLTFKDFYYMHPSQLSDYANINLIFSNEDVEIFTIASKEP